MRINIVTSGRFHVLDLARELDALGHEVRFYSCVPRQRAMHFGLPGRCHRRLLSWLVPVYWAVLRAPKPAAEFAANVLARAIDRTAALWMKRCDAFIGMSGLCVASASAARRAGAKVFLERGSRHILSQKEILESIPGHRIPAIPASVVARELAGYGIAHSVVVPSRHVEMSFRESGFPSTSLFRNPYGVDLRDFGSTEKPDNPVPVVVMIGTWSLQKGCDLLWKACEAAGSWKLLHVGAIGDAPVPESALFAHVEPVAQWELPRLLERADVLALPSRHDGFGMVLAQALACGLPVVCSDRTGGTDLREMLGPEAPVFVVPHDDLEALGRAVDAAIAVAARQRGRRDLLGAARERLSWAAYGRRYSEELERRCSP